MDLEVAKFWILDAKKYGLKYVALSGGETRCYPRLLELILFARQQDVKVAVAFSGWGIDQSFYNKLVDVDVSDIYISLNGSTEKVNKKSRDGYYYAINALQLLKDNHFSKTTINWVMHSSNSDDFANMILLAEKYEVKSLAVMAFKPDAQNCLPSLPSSDQMYSVARQIKEYRGPVQLQVESCYSPMLAIIRDTKLFGNLNRGEYKGCRAGKNLLSVNVDGTLSPCRHIHISEKRGNLEMYLSCSPTIQQIQNCKEENAEEPCKGCNYGPYCRHCLAINSCINKRIYIGNAFCPLANNCK